MTNKEPLEIRLPYVDDEMNEDNNKYTLVEVSEIHDKGKEPKAFLEITNFTNESPLDTPMIENWADVLLDAEQAERVGNRLLEFAARAK